jgi:molecular chaperone DnaJ
MQQASAHDDLYGLLGIHPAAPLAEITLAYRKCARAWHPDRNGAADAAERFRRIRHAYEVLRDPQRRAAYDRTVPVRSARRRPSATEANTQPPSPQPAGERAPDMRRRVRITLAEQIAGCRHTLKLTRTEYCARCGGTGDARLPAVACGTCRGSGEVRETLGFFPFFRYEARPCTDCEGTGAIRPRCKACAGSGVETKKTGLLRFAIPAGIRPETSLRVRGHGKRSRAGAACGDLVIRVGLAPHPLFVPVFPDLACTMPVSAFRLLAGGSVVVPTLATSVSVPLPRDAADGSELRIAGEGLLDATTGERGDLVVTLRAIRPRRLTAEAHALVAQLDTLVADDPTLAEWSRRQRDAQRDRSNPD